MTIVDGFNLCRLVWPWWRSQLRSGAKSNKHFISYIKDHIPYHGPAWLSRVHDLIHASDWMRSNTSIDVGQAISQWQAAARDVNQNSLSERWNKSRYNWWPSPVLWWLQGWRLDKTSVEDILYICMSFWQILLQNIIVVIISHRTILLGPSLFKEIVISINNIFICYHSKRSTYLM